MDDNIKKIPITHSQRRKNKMGPLVVECQVSGRRIKFREKSANLNGGEFIVMDIYPMQIDDEIEPKKLCEIIVTREDLLLALSNITPE